MNPKIKLTLFLLLILNLIFVVYIIHINGYSIKNRILKLITREKSMPVEVFSSEKIADLNNCFIDTSNNKSGTEIKILIIGNSLTYTPELSAIGWDHSSGMAASSIKTDFAHQLLKLIDSRLPDHRIKLRIARLTEFERKFINFEFNTIDSLVNYHPDIVIFQLGENVSLKSTNAPELFAERYIDLINYFRTGSIYRIICTPFFPSYEKNEIIKQVAIKTQSAIAELSHLTLLDQRNYAKFEEGYQGNTTRWKHVGIDMHPGDLGMENIARQIFISLNSALPFIDSKLPKNR